MTTSRERILSECTNSKFKHGGMRFPWQTPSKLGTDKSKYCRFYKSTYITSRIAFISRMQSKYWFEMGTSNITKRRRALVNKHQKLKTSNNGRSPLTSMPYRSPWASHSQNIFTTRTWITSSFNSPPTVLRNLSPQPWSSLVGDSIGTRLGR